MSEVTKIKSKRSWNKTDLTFLLANEARIPKIRAARYINILTDTIAEALERGKKVTISDFGTFQVSERSSFAGRNPKTGAPIKVPVRRIPVFRAGKRLKTSLNTPQLKECRLQSSKNVVVKFSKLMDEESKLLLDATSYDVLIDGKSIGTVKTVQVEDREQSTDNGNLKGVRSVVLTCPQQLRGKDLQVVFKAPIPDINGNIVSFS